MPRKKGTPPTGRQVETLFKKGQVANPSGRSGAHQRLQVALEETMQEFLQEQVEGSIGGKKVNMTRLKMMLHRLFKEAVEGKSVVPATSEIFDRAFGKARQPLDHTGIGPVYITDDIGDEVPDPRKKG